MNKNNITAAATFLAEAARQLDSECASKKNPSIQLGLFNASALASALATQPCPKLVEVPDGRPSVLVLRAHDALIDEFEHAPSSNLLALTVRVGVLCRELVHDE